MMATEYREPSHRTLSVPDYRLEERLGESPQSVVYRGFSRRDSQTPLSVKVLKVGVLSDLQKVHFRQKIEHLRVLADDALLPPLAFEMSNDTCVITRRHFDGLTLNDWVSGKTACRSRTSSRSRASSPEACPRCMRPGSSTEA